MKIKRGSDLETLLMLCALADPDDARAWLYDLNNACVCPLSSAGNTFLGRRCWSIFPSTAAQFMGFPLDDPHGAREMIMDAADNITYCNPDIRAALEAMFPNKEK